MLIQMYARAWRPRPSSNCRVLLIVVARSRAALSELLIQNCGDLWYILRKTSSYQFSTTSFDCSAKSAMSLHLESVFPRSLCPGTPHCSDEIISTVSIRVVNVSVCRLRIYVYIYVCVCVSKRSCCRETISSPTTSPLESAWTLGCLIC